MISTATLQAPDTRATHAALRLALAFAVCKLLLQFALTLYTTHLGYSYFRDEFYYILCGRHLAWGYVDHGPLVAVQARLGELLFGDSVFGIRVLSAVAGALTVFLGGRIAAALGGGRPAQVLTMLGLLVCPQYIGVDGFLSMNSYEAVFWSLCLLAVIHLVNGAPPLRWYLLLGASAGLGLLNKPSMTFFLAALICGLCLTPQRRWLLRPFAGIAAVFALVLLAPYAHWQQLHGWPTLEFLQNGRIGGKAVVLNPLQFLLAQVSIFGPLNAFLWIPGVIALLRDRSLATMRWLGFTFQFFFVLMYALHAKDYYLEGIYPAFFAAGGLAWERHFANSPRVVQQRWLAFPVFEALTIILGLLVLPMSSPVLRPAAWVHYTQALHLPHDNTESARTGPLPQFFADRFGWEHQVEVVARTFRHLSPAEQHRVCLFGGNYGEAGAIDFLGALHQDALPPAVSGQNNYWLWGTHHCDPNLVIAVIHDSPAAVAQKYSSVTVVGTRNDPYAMPFEHGNIYLLRNRRPSAPFHWEDERFYY